MRILKSFSWVIVDNLFSLGIQLLSAIILARLLTPNDYGIIGMITIFIAISNMVVDSGMGGSLIKKNIVTNIDYSTLFIYNILVSLLLYGILFFISDYVALFYKVASLSKIIKIVSLVIIINAFSIVQNIRLVKHLHFKKLALCSFASNITSLIAAIVFAVHGYGVWSLVFQQLIQSSIKTILIYIVDKFFPKLIFSFISFKEQFAFGVNLLFSNLLNTFYNNISFNLIAKINTPVQTGFYLQASKFQSLPIGIVNAVVDKAIFPILSKYKTKSEIFLNYSRFVRYITIFVYPLIFFISALSSNLITLLLGNRWSQSGELLGILIFAGLGSTLQYINRNLLKSLGITKLILKIDIISIVIGLFILFIVASRGVYYIAIGVVISSLISVGIQSILISITTKYSLKEQIKNISTAVFISVSIFIVLKLFLFFIHFTPILELVLGGLISIIVFIVASVIFAKKDIYLFVNNIKFK